MTPLQSEYGHMTIQQFVNHFEKGQLNLEPGFQRNSVWSINDRQALIESVFLNYPMPSVFLYKRQDVDGDLIYDVIDGKQRLESIFMFMRLRSFRRDGYSALAKLSPKDDEADWYDWARVRRRDGEYAFSSYRIQTVEVSGELSDIIDVFVRINSTGKKLSSAEKRHAKYYNSEFLKMAGKLADRFEGYYRRHRILSSGAISRMKHVELTCELMASIARGRPLNKKKALDQVIGGQTIEGAKLKKWAKEFVRIANLVGKMFPRLRETRFANAVDYYSLFLLVWELDGKGCVLKNAMRNRQAEKLLLWLSVGVDQVRQQQRKAIGANLEQRLFANYLMTVQGDTDSQATRERRSQLLHGLLAGLFEKKDERRGFSAEQRRLIWHSDGTKRCSYPGCAAKLDWTNFTIDHIKPFAKGGRTSSKNAALMCKRHNSMKGAG
jgi:Protein of unknown function DUF262/HNH endonuclease